MIKIAFIKFGGMAMGGTETVLQTIAANLPKNEFKVDYFYCDAAPYLGSDYKHIDTDPSRVEYVKKNGVNLIKFTVKYKDVRTPTHDWVDTNFWETFTESKYDLIMTGRSGHPEYPFTLINSTPIIDSIHLPGMAENKSNTYKTVLLSQEQKQKWIDAGGAANKAIIIPNPIDIPSVSEDFRKELGLVPHFIFGFHQRPNNEIYSPIPLEAYKEIETNNTAFILLGGGTHYRDQARQLNLKNIHFLESCGDTQVIHKFLNTLDVFAHGRKDGEQCSCAIIEAMSHSLPFVSHTAPSMGHKEQIANSGKVCIDTKDYAATLKKFYTDQDFLKRCKESSRDRYENTYSLNSILQQYIDLYKEAAYG